MSTDTYLRTLYPSLRGDRPPDAEPPIPALAETAQLQAADSVAAITDFFDRQSDALVEAARTTADSIHRGGRLFGLGTGPCHYCVCLLAAAFASHPDAPTPLLTVLGTGPAIAHGPSPATQLRTLGRSGDGLVVLTAGDDDESVAATCREAKALGLFTLVIGGDDDRGQVRRERSPDHRLTISTQPPERILECQLAIVHVLHRLIVELSSSRGTSA